MHPPSLTHIDESGHAHMVDIGDKPVSHREAVAEGFVMMSAEAARVVRERTAAKGDVLQIATIAAIQAAKQTSHWIPLCHIVPLEHVGVDFSWADENQLRVEVKVRTSGKTGVEMEALTATSAAALTIYDMCKSIDRGMVIQKIQLVSKIGGTRGSYERSDNRSNATL
jgi:cyclic pyranopterin phosphate synthase